MNMHPLYGSCSKLLKTCQVTIFTCEFWKTKKKKVSWLFQFGNMFNFFLSILFHFINNPFNLRSKLWISNHRIPVNNHKMFHAVFRPPNIQLPEPYGHRDLHVLQITWKHLVVCLTRFGVLECNTCTRFSCYRSYGYQQKILFIVFKMICLDQRYY